MTSLLYNTTSERPCLLLKRLTISCNRSNLEKSFSSRAEALPFRTHAIAHDGRCSRVVEYVRRMQVISPEVLVEWDETFLSEPVPWFWCIRICITAEC